MGDDVGRAVGVTRAAIQSRFSGVASEKRHGAFVLRMGDAMRIGLKFLIAIAISLPGGAFAQDFDAKGRAKMAEMMAFLREETEVCGQVPEAWGLEVLGEYVAAGKKAPAEEEIASKQDEIRAFKAKAGTAKWCALYRLDMQFADMVAHLQQ